MRLILSDTFTSIYIHSNGFIWKRHECVFLDTPFYIFSIYIMFVNIGSIFPNWALDLKVNYIIYRYCLGYYSKLVYVCKF